MFIGERCRQIEMNMKILSEPLVVFFLACMKPLVPLRRRGAFGTPDDPRYFDEGESVPWWIECRWPLDMFLVFGCAVETYFEGGAQIVRPIDSHYDAVIRGDAGGRYVVLVGAPTKIISAPRPRLPKWHPRPAPVCDCSLSHFCSLAGSIPAHGKIMREILVEGARSWLDTPVSPTSAGTEQA